MVKISQYLRKAKHNIGEKIYSLVDKHQFEVFYHVRLGKLLGTKNRK